MRPRAFTNAVSLGIACLCASLAPPGTASGQVIVAPEASPRVQFGGERLTHALRSVGRGRERLEIRVGPRASSIFEGLAGLPEFGPDERERFHLERRGSRVLVVGSDDSGALYGALELADRIREESRVPRHLELRDGPQFRIRGTNLFWMKWGQQGYNWSLTPESFPWFYDRELMLRYLDQLAENRYNAIFFWTAHPFPFLLPLPEYPEAQMLTDEELERNIEHFQWFTREADRRGIWTVVHFYNIHVSPTFAKAHEAEGVKTENPAATPLLTAYTRYCVKEFVESYPSVGLLVTAGEALRVNSEEWVRDAIVTGIEDSGKQAPLIVRQWSISAKRYEEVIKPSYGNLFTMMKHNIEMIVSPYPDNRNQIWTGFGDHIINVHENSDIKPFRWGSPLFVRQMIEQWQKLGVAGFHLYPLVSWQWPDSLDDTQPRLSAVERDVTWIELFGRYGWNNDRDAAGEKRFWIERLARRFGSRETGEAVYEFYVRTGPILPGIQNVVNIYNMNFHPTAVSQEASLNGLLHADRRQEVDASLARPLDAYSLDRYEERYGPVASGGRSKPPLSVKQIVNSGRPGNEAVDPIRLAALYSTLAEEAQHALRGARPANAKDEYARFLADAQMIGHLARFYERKLEAAYEKGLYDRTGDVARLDRMLELTRASLDSYASLSEQATGAYRQATDLDASYRWDKTLDSFRRELAFYEEQRSMRAAGADVVILGIDGPVSDASNVFHWLVHRGLTASGWTIQSYAVGEDFLQRAKLVIVYDTRSHAFRSNEQKLADWVRRGGRLVIWDPLVRAASSSLLEGIQFSSNEAYQTTRSIGFAEDSHPLTRGLAGEAVGLRGADLFLAGVERATTDWKELAFTVMVHKGRRQFYVGHQTFGPRWTTQMNPVKVPVILSRTLGKGEIVLMQIGVYTIGPKFVIPPDPTLDEPPDHLVALVDNLVRWARQ